jgi:hypothetical protein
MEIAWLLFGIALLGIAYLLSFSIHVAHPIEWTLFFSSRHVVTSFFVVILNSIGSHGLVLSQDGCEEYAYHGRPGTPNPLRGFGSVFFGRAEWFELQEMTIEFWIKPSTTNLRYNGRRRHPPMIDNRELRKRSREKKKEIVNSYESNVC